MMDVETFLEIVDGLKGFQQQDKMGLTQQEAYDAYLNATTDGTRVLLHDSRVVHDHFIRFVENYQRPSSAPVVSRQDFLDNLLTRTFHLYWAANLSPPAFGVGNPVTFSIRLNDVTGKYELSYHSLTEVTQTHSFDPSQYILHSNSLMLMDGNKQMIIKRTPSRTVNDVVVWNHQLRIDNNNVLNYYMVDFQL